MPATFPRRMCASTVVSGLPLHTPATRTMQGFPCANLRSVFTYRLTRIGNVDTALCHRSLDERDEVRELRGRETRTAAYRAQALAAKSFQRLPAEMLSQEVFVDIVCAPSL